MFLVMRNPRRQGDRGEALGDRVVGEPGLSGVDSGRASPDIDLVTMIDDRLVGVQVKTSTLLRNGRFDVTVCTRGGNRSWSYEIEPGRPLVAAIAA